MTEDEMVRQHHRLDGHEFEQAPGVGDGQGSLECCSPWGRKVSDMTQRLNHCHINNHNKGKEINLLKDFQIKNKTQIQKAYLGICCP